MEVNVSNTSAVENDDKLEEYRKKLEARGCDQKLIDRMMDGLKCTGMGAITLTDTAVHTLLDDHVLTRGYGLTVLQGPGQIGKTQLLASVVAHMSHGQDTPLGALTEPGKPLKSLVFASDGGGSTGWERALIDRGADMDQICLVSSFSPAMPRSLTDISIELFLDCLHPDLVIFDSLSSFTGGKIEGRQDVDGLSALNLLAVKYGCALVVINHYNKSGGWAGSQGVMDACREMYSMGPVYGIQDTIYFAPEKTSHRDRNGCRLRWFHRYSTAAGPELQEIPVPSEHSRHPEAKTAAYWSDYADKQRSKDNKSDGRKPVDPEATAKAKAKAVIIGALATAAALGTVQLSRKALMDAGVAAGIDGATTRNVIAALEKEDIIAGTESTADRRERVYALKRI